MSAAQPKASELPEALLEALDGLSAEELAAVVRHAVALRAHRVAALPSLDESQLLERINRTLSADRLARYEALCVARDAGSLDDAAHRELLALSDELEALDADRLAAVASLASARGVSLDVMYATLGIGDRAA